MKFYESLECFENKSNQINQEQYKLQGEKQYFLDVAYGKLIDNQNNSYSFLEIKSQQFASKQNQDLLRVYYENKGQKYFKELKKLSKKEDKFQIILNDGWIFLEDFIQRNELQNQKQVKKIYKKLLKILNFWKIKLHFSYQKFILSGLNILIRPSQINKDDKNLEVFILPLQLFEVNKLDQNQFLSLNLPLEILQKNESKGLRLNQKANIYILSIQILRILQKGDQKEDLSYPLSIQQRKGDLNLDPYNLQGLIQKSEGEEILFKKIDNLVKEKKLGKTLKSALLNNVDLRFDENQCLLSLIQEIDLERKIENQEQFNQQSQSINAFQSYQFSNNIDMPSIYSFSSEKEKDEIINNLKNEIKLIKQKAGNQNKNLVMAGKQNIHQQQLRKLESQLNEQKEETEKLQKIFKKIQQNYSNDYAFLQQLNLLKRQYNIEQDQEDQFSSSSEEDEQKIENTSESNTNRQFKQKQKRNQRAETNLFEDFKLLNSFKEDGLDQVVTKENLNDFPIVQNQNQEDSEIQQSNIEDYIEGIIGVQEQKISSKNKFVTESRQRFLSVFGKEYECLWSFQNTESYGTNIITYLTNGRIAEGGDDNVINIWNVRDGTLERVLTGHSYPIVTLCVIKEGKLLASGSQGETSSMKFWDLRTGICLKSIRAHDDTISSIVKIDNDTVASASHDQTIKVWKWKQSELLYTLKGHWMPILCLRKLEEGYIASGSDDCSIRIWSLQQQKEIFIWNITKSWIQIICYIQNNILAAGDASGGLYLINYNSGDLEIEWQNHTSNIVDISLNQEKNEMLSCGADGLINVYDLLRKELIQTIKLDDYITSVCYCNQFIITAQINSEFSVFGKINEQNENFKKGEKLQIKRMSKQI